MTALNNHGEGTVLVETNEEKILEKFIAIGLWGRLCQKKVRVGKYVETAKGLERIVKMADESIIFMKKLLDERR